METKTRSIKVIEKGNFSEDTINLLNLMGLASNGVKEAIWCDELCDLTFVVEDNLQMRDMRPRFREIAPILDRLKIRNLCSTSKSNCDDFDFETRVFCPHDNLDEDTACGSSNLSIAKYWEKWLGKSEFKVLFPYHISYENRAAGGVQFVKLEQDRVFVGGFCE
jgi:predicted PhzF superfamily epimerase YddE/YHI9